MELAYDTIIISFEDEKDCDFGAEEQFKHQSDERAEEKELIGIQDLLAIRGI